MNDTNLCNIISTKLSLKFPFQLLYGEWPMLRDTLKVFDEVGFVTTKEKMQS
jgi:hypothetical protein